LIRFLLIRAINTKPPDFHQAASTFTMQWDTPTVHFNPVHIP
jgi:hypothetical protein